MLSGSNDSKLTSQQVDPKVVPLYQVWQELVPVLSKPMLNRC